MGQERGKWGCEGGLKKGKKSFRNWSAKKRKQWKLTYARNSNNWHAGNYFPLRLIGIFCWFFLPFAVVVSVELFGGGNFSEIFGENRLYPGIAIDIWSVGVRTGLPFPIPILIKRGHRLQQFSEFYTSNTVCVLGTFLFKAFTSKGEGWTFFLLLLSYR